MSSFLDVTIVRLFKQFFFHDDDDDGGGGDDDDVDSDDDDDDDDDAGKNEGWTDWMLDAMKSCRLF